MARSSAATVTSFIGQASGPLLPHVGEARNDASIGRPRTNPRKLLARSHLDDVLIAFTMAAVALLGALMSAGAWLPADRHAVVREMSAAGGSVPLPHFKPDARRGR
jgi:hypothetical protein